MRILYFDLDTLRPDHLGCYGYPAPTSPNIDRIASEGVTFASAYCQSSPCVPSRANLLSGRYGVHHGALTHWGTGSHFNFPGEGHHYEADRPLLTRHLRTHGYKTVSFSSFADRHQAFWFCAGWEEMHTPTLKQGGESGEEITDAVLPWLKENGARDDYFLHIHYWDAHRTYRIPPDEVHELPEYETPDWPDLDTILAQQDDAGPFTANELYPFGAGTNPTKTMPNQISNRNDFDTLVRAYDASIRHLDTQIGIILSALDDLHVLEDTAIIVSGDHGEAMGEHGIYADHVCADESVHHIPLIIRWPNADQTRGTTHMGLHYNLDLLPTLCDLLEIPTPVGWDGTTFEDAVKRPNSSSGRSHLVWEHGLYCCQRAVRTPQWLYIHTYHPGLFDWQPEALYQIANDPHMAHDLKESEPEQAAMARNLLQEWLSANLPDPTMDPLIKIAKDGPFRYVGYSQWISRLESAGRHAAATSIQENIHKYETALSSHETMT